MNTPAVADPATSGPARTNNQNTVLFDPQVLKRGLVKLALVAREAGEEDDLEVRSALAALAHPGAAEALSAIQAASQEVS